MAADIKIIADGAVLKALELALGGVEFFGDYTEPSTSLVVYGESLTAGISRRSENGGLKRLQKVLANPRSVPINIAVLSFGSHPKTSTYGYLVTPPSPIRYFRLPTTLPLPPGSISSSAQWRELTRTASEMELEIVSSTYRHGLRSVMAAARIYLGAAIMNHVTLDQCEIAVKKFRTMAQQEDPSVNLDDQELLKRLNEHQRFRADYGSIPKPRKRTLWVLDDHWKDHGWNIVFDDLLPGTTQGFTKWDGLESEIQNSRVPDVLIVDCNLGEGGAVPTGLELLRSIRSVWQDVRVVFATAYDDAALALVSLREGANVFFAKALDDPADRRSKDYYLHLLDILRPSHAIESDVSRLWKVFTEGPPAPDPLRGKNGLPPPPDTFYRMFRLGFYLLFSLIDDNLWWRGKEWLATDEKHLFRAVINLVRAGCPAIKGELESMPKPVMRALKGGPHGGELVNFDSVKEVFQYIFDQFEFEPQRPTFKPWSRNWPEYWPYRWPAQLQTDSTYPGLPIGQTPAPHEVADSQGAIELIRGAYCKNGCKKKAAHRQLSLTDVLDAHGKKVPQTGLYDDICFIDDRGNETGWFDALQVVFPGCRCFTSVDSFLERPSKTNLVILDLRLPTVNKGREALRQVLDRDSSLPILTISAAGDSLAAIRSLRDGAFEHVSKTLPGHRDLTGCFQFYDELVSKCELLLGYGKSNCRRNWKRLAYLRQGISWISEEARRAAEVNFKQCEMRYKKLTRDMSRSELAIPPPIEEWSSRLSDELALALRLQQQVFWISEKKTLAPDTRRLNYSRVLQIRPIDYWRWEHVLGSGKVSPLVKLIAIVCGVIVDRLAQWNWSMTHLEPVNPHLWGARSDYGIRIEDEVKLVCGQIAWDYRNLAINDAKTTRWNLKIAEKAVDSVFDAINSFLAQNNAWFGTP
jgi:FixJ family two-component response regulator